MFFFSFYNLAKRVASSIGKPSQVPRTNAPFAKKKNIYLFKYFTGHNI